MSKLKYFLFISLAVLVAVLTFSTVLFLLTEEHNAVFWVHYGFIMVSFVSFYIALVNVLIKPQTLNQAFLSEPYLSVSIIYVILQTAFGLWAIISGYIPLRIGLCVDISLLGLFLAVTILLVVVITMNRNIDKEQSDNRQFIKNLQYQLQGLEFCDNAVQKAYLNLMDNMKFSIPSGKNITIELEQQIIETVLRLQKSTKDASVALNNIKELDRLIKKRNTLVKN